MSERVYRFSINGVTVDEAAYLESQQERLGQEVEEAFNAAFDAWLQAQIEGTGIKNPKGLLESDVTVTGKPSR